MRGILNDSGTPALLRQLAVSKHIQKCLLEALNRFTDKHQSTFSSHLCSILHAVADISNDACATLVRMGALGAVETAINQTGAQSIADAPWSFRSLLERLIHHVQQEIRLGEKRDFEKLELK